MTNLISSTLRFSGLASGIDVDSIVSQLMKAERTRVDKLYQQKQLVEWQQQDYRDMNLKLKALYDNVFNMKLQGTYFKYKATGIVSTTGNSADSYFTATPGSTAIQGTYSIEVKSIAKNAQVISIGGISADPNNKIDPNQSIVSQSIVSQPQSKFINDPIKDSDSGIVNYNIEFKINDQDFKFDLNGTEKDYSINDILAKINSNTAANVYAYYDNATDRIIINSKDIGSNAEVKIENISGNLFGDTGALKIADNSANPVKGQDANIEINGVSIVNSSNTFTALGIQFNLKNATPDGTTINLSVTPDIDGVVDNIKNFIKQYNDTIDAINAKLSEERYRDYPPLTDEQKQQMKDTDIKLWEDKAKSGLLRSDPLLSGIIDKMRQALYTPVSGLRSDMNTLSEIGITTGSYWEKGKLYLDEDKLRDALAKDPDAVMKLFTASSDDNNADNDGVAVRLYDIIKSGMDSITEKAGGGDYQLFDDSILGKQVRDISDRISDMEDQLIRIEERYYNQFTQMEQAIAYMNQQSMWLSQQLSGMSQG